MKKKLSILLVLTIIVLQASMLSAFKSCQKDPWTFANTTWYSIDPEIEIKRDHTGYVVVDGETIEITMGRNPSKIFYVCDAKEEVHSNDTMLLKGKYVYKDNKIIVTITQDKLFDNKYSEIVFEARVEEA